MSSPLFAGLTALAGAFTLALGIVHIAIPRLVGYGSAIGSDGAVPSPSGPTTLGTIGAGRLTYRVRRNDLVGQFALGRRASDVLAAAWFSALAVGHLVLAFGVG